MHLPFKWEPGQHLSIIGMTGSGKSTLAERILRHRRYALIFKSKADRVSYQDTQTIKTTKAMLNSTLNRLVLSPKYETQDHEFARALDLTWKQGGWTIYLDEVFYLDKLGLRLFIERLLTQGRSKGISVVSGMQRPVSVTRFAIGESSHVISFGLEGRDAKILGEVASPKLIPVVQDLARHEFVWYSVIQRQYWRGRIQDLEAQIN